MAHRQRCAIVVFIFNEKSAKRKFYSIPSYHEDEIFFSRSVFETTQNGFSLTYYIMLKNTRHLFQNIRHIF